MAAHGAWTPTAGRNPRSVALAVAVGGLMLLAACSSAAGGGSGGASGDPATWELTGDVTPESHALELGVTRLGCAGGVTGEVLEPQVVYEDDRIVITVDVATLGDGAYTCPGNDVVPVVVELDEPVGERTLVDGACLDGEAATTSFCGDELRWP